MSKEHNDESLRNVKLVKEKVENWEDGHRFNERPSDSDIRKWTDSLK